MAQDDLPEGWDVVSIHQEGHEPLTYPGDDLPTDWEIAHADAIVVSHWDDDADVWAYRTVHGAEDWEGLVDIIEYMESAYFG